MASSSSLLLSLSSSSLSSFKTHKSLCNPKPSSTIRSKPYSKRCSRIKSLQETKETDTARPADEITEKYGLEVGLWKIFSSNGGKKEEGTSKSKTDQAKELLAKYGGAYLATSITLSLISFSLCYLLVSVGIDVQTLLQKVGISTNEAGEKVGTFAIAYARIRLHLQSGFRQRWPLTPIVAGWIGKKVK